MTAAKTSTKVQEAAHAETDPKSMSPASATQARDDSQPADQKVTLESLAARLAVVEAELAHYKAIFSWPTRHDPAAQPPNGGAEVASTGA